MASAIELPTDLVTRIWDLYQGIWNHDPDYGVHFSRPQLQSLIETVYQASLRTDESRPVTFQVNFSSSLDKLTLKFDDDLDCSAQQLTKLAPTIGIGNRWVLVSPNADGTLSIKGVSDPQITPGGEASRNLWADGLLTKTSSLEGMKISVHGPGEIRVAIDTEYVVELSDCKIIEPTLIHAVTPIRTWFEEVAGGLINNLNAPDLTNVAAALVRRVWTNIFRKTVYAAHGGCFLILPPGEPLEESIVKPKYKLHSDCLVQMLVRRLKLEPWISEIKPTTDHVDEAERIWQLCNAHFSERDLARACDLVASLAQVDGAVIVRRDLLLEGFGAEILLTQAPGAEEIIEYFIPPYRVVQEPLGHAGTRHRSAFRFCQKVEGAIAVVISQDGGIKVFSNQGRTDAKGYKNLSADDWLIP